MYYTLCKLVDGRASKQKNSALPFLSSGDYPPELYSNKSFFRDCESNTTVVFCLRCQTKNIFPFNLFPNNQIAFLSVLIFLLIISSDFSKHFWPIETHPSENDATWLFSSLFLPSCGKILRKRMQNISATRPCFQMLTVCQCLIFPSGWLIAFANRSLDLSFVPSHRYAAE